jgi:hypothetical protein
MPSPFISSSSTLPPCLHPSASFLGISTHYMLSFACSCMLVALLAHFGLLSSYLIIPCLPTSIPHLVFITLLEKSFVTIPSILSPLSFPPCMNQSSALLSIYFVPSPVMHKPLPPPLPPSHIHFVPSPVMNELPAKPPPSHVTTAYFLKSTILQILDYSIKHLD